MSSAEISLATAEQEIEDAREYCELYGWKVSPIDKDHMLFTVLMRSPIDGEEYLIEFVFEGYPELPYLIDFIHPSTGERRMAKCIPKCKNENFFHTGAFVICHPFNRRAYKDYSNVHGEWKLEGWQANTNGITSLKGILNVIYTKISNTAIYEGRMDKPVMERR